MMYLSNDRRKLFLLFLQPDSNCSAPIKCVVRKVALVQFGHFMMGTARLFGRSVTVSGSYGGDGLPCSVPQEIYDRAPLELPKELYDAWNKGGGWNSAGREGPSVRKWALDNLKALKS